MNYKDAAALDYHLTVPPKKYYEEDTESDPLLVDDFDQNIDEDDVILKIIFKKREITCDCVITTKFIKYIRADHLVDALDEWGWDNYVHLIPLEGAEYISHLVNSTLKREEVDEHGKR